MLPYLHLDLPVTSLLNPQWRPDNQGQDYWTMIYRFGQPREGENTAIPGRHGVENTTQYIADPRELLSEELVDFMTDQGVITDHRGGYTGALFVFFHRPSGRPGPIHADWGPDPSKPRNHWAINWCEAAEQDQHMMWYEPLDPRLDEEGFPVTAGRMNGWSKIPEFPPEAVREIARTTITRPTLVRTDIPHNAHNSAKATRWAFSFRGRREPDWPSAYQRWQRFADREAERGTAE